MEQMLDDGRHDEVEEIFHVCGEIETEQDRQIFFATMSAFYSLLAQFDEYVVYGGAGKSMTCLGSRLG